jgi:hypothetical protein
MDLHTGRKRRKLAILTDTPEQKVIEERKRCSEVVGK